jgi:gas vesicle protein
MYENENSVGMRGGSAFTGFVMGALVGAGIALLMAPATGSETRKRLRETAQRLKSTAGSKLGDAQTAIGEIRDDAKSAFTAGREAYTRNRQQRNPSDVESPFATDPANPR